MAPAHDHDPGDLLTRHQGQIGRLVRRLVGADDAADVEQELHLAALERPPRNRVALPAWIATTVRNLVAKRWRGRARLEARERAAAVPEPLPSTDELVARVELEEFLLRCVRELAEPERVVVLLRFFEGRSAAEIAQQLKLGESTVRARLARALARLRERLDAKSGGDRKQWVAAFAPLAPFAPFVPGVGIVMTGKFVAAASIVLATGAAIWFEAAARRDANHDEVALASRGAQLADAVPAASIAQSLAEPARVAEPVAAADPPLDSARPPTSAGRLAFRVVDAATSLPLDPVTARAINATRFAVIQGSGPLEALLSPGSYDVAFTVPGYEPEVRHAVVVAPGERDELGTIALGRGTATLVGCVRSPGLPSDARRYVELRGDGRSPCPRCDPARAAAAAAVDASEDLEDLRVIEKSMRREEEIEATRLDADVMLRKLHEARIVESPCCGWFPERSFVRVGGDGRFEFTGLAAGVYFVRALDASPRVVTTLRLEITRGERRFVDLTLVADVNLQVDLRDESGRPFVGRWKNDWSEETAPIHFIVDVDGVLIPMDAAVAAEDVRAQFGSPARLGQPPDPKEAALATTDPPESFSPVMGHFPTLLGERSRDRARAPFDALFPVAPTPSFAGAEYGLRNERPGSFVLTHLPGSRVKLTANCCGLTSTEVEVDLAKPAQRSVKLVINTK